MDIEFKKGCPEIIFNNLPQRPQNHIGQLMQYTYNTEIAVAPPQVDGFYYVGVKPIMLVEDGNSGKELFRFQTLSTYQFNSAPTQQDLFNTVHSCILDAIRDFSNFLLNTKSTLGYGREMPTPSFDDTISRTKIAIGLNHVN